MRRRSAFSLYFYWPASDLRSINIYGDEGRGIFQVIRAQRSVVCMGDLQVWPQPNGALTEESALSVNPHPSAIGANRWARAERRTSDILCRIQPTVASERRRKEVIDYVQRLIQRHLGCQVFSFGSVPLKTYLPDGDIDLTIFGNFQNVEDAWANELCSILEGEERSKVAEFEVKEVQYINAEVRLVKCLIENIVVDISFNQLGGLSTLCFLEQVDRLIGKDHLFKRSIILIKTWCYYESRILGAPHGLISTYALETLVMYIFNLFHASLCGPLEVLYKFLDYFSKFDWDNYCVSIQGPVSISSLPEMVAIPPETDGGQLLLSMEFLQSCTNLDSTAPKGHDNQIKLLSSKYLNVIDPLRENNNLGRSVSKGNFYRIRSAFTYGARKLGKILLSTEGKIADELDKFFLNTLARHGNGQRPDVPDSVLNETSHSQETEAQAPEKGIPSKKSACESFRLHKMPLSAEDRDTTAGDYWVCSKANLSGEVGNDKNSLVDFGIKFMRGCPEVTPFAKNLGGDEIEQGMKSPSFSDAQRECSTRINTAMPEEGNHVCGSRLAGDAKDLASNHHAACKISGSQYPGLLQEQRTLTKGCNFQQSETARMRGIAGSVPTCSDVHSPSTVEKGIAFEGDLIDESASNLTCNETAVSCDRNYPAVCVYNDNRSANYTKQVSIGTNMTIQHETVDGKSGLAMNKTLQTDIPTTYTTALPVIHTSEVASCLSSSVAGSFSLSSKLAGPSSLLSAPIGHSTISFLNSSTSSSFISHDSTLHVPSLASSSIEDRVLESGKMKQNKLHLSKLYACATSKMREISEQGIFTSEMLSEDGFNASRHDGKFASASSVNLVPTEQEAVSGAYEYPESLSSSSTAPANITNFPPLGLVSSFSSSRCNGPALGVYDSPAQLNYRVSTAVDPPLSLGKKASVFPVGSVQPSADTFESLQHPLNDISLGMSSCIDRLAGSIISNIAIQSSGVSFPSVDISNPFSTIESNSEVQNSVTDVAGSFKDCEARENLRSSAICTDRTNAVSSASAACNDRTNSIDSTSLNSMSRGGMLDDFNCMSDLTGDFDSHLSSLAYGRWCQDSALYGSVLPLSMLPSYMQEPYVWEGHARPFLASMNMLCYRRGRGDAPVHPFLHAGYIGASPSVIPLNFSVEELPKSRNGTGTYIPNLNHRSYKGRYPPNRGRSQGASAQDFTSHVIGQKHRPRSNGRSQSMFDSNCHMQTGNKNSEASLLEGKNGDHEMYAREPLCKSSIQLVSDNVVLASSGGSVVPEICSLTDMGGHKKLPPYIEAKPPAPPFAMMEHSSNDLNCQLEQLEFGSFGPVQLVAVPPVAKSQQGSHKDCAVSNGQLFNSGLAAPSASSSEKIGQKAGALINHERVASRSYHLNEEDFPPLSFPKQYGGNSTGAGNASSSSQCQTSGEIS